MKDISAMLRVVKSPHLQKETTVFDVVPDDSLVQNLLHLTATNPTLSDSGASELLYGKRASKHKFALVKSKLKKRMLSSLLLLDFSDDSNSKRDATRHRLLKLYAQANLLQLFGARAAAVRLLLRSEQQAARFHLTAVRLQFANMLATHYWFVSDAKEYERWSRQINKLRQMLNDELDSDQLYRDASFHAIAQVGSEAQEAKSEVSDALTRIEKMDPVGSSYPIQLNRIRIELLKYQLENDHAGVTRVALQAMRSKLNSGILYNKSFHSYLLLTATEAYLLNQEFSRSLALIEEGRSLMPEEHSNRLILERICVLATIASQNAPDAVRLIMAARSMPAFSRQHSKALREWDLVEQYARLLESLHKGISPAEYRVVKPAPSEQLRKIHSSRQERMGIQIPILIGRTVDAIIRADYRLLLRLDKTLDNYQFRYLNRSRGHARTRTVVTLLRKLIKNDLNARLCEPSIRKATESLRVQPQEGFRPDIEIVPYEVLINALSAHLSALAPRSGR